MGDKFDKTRNNEATLTSAVAKRVITGRASAAGGGPATAWQPVKVISVAVGP